MGIDFCENCHDKDSCTICNLGLEWGCPKYDLLKKRTALMGQLATLASDGSAYTSSETEDIAKDAIVIINSMMKGWL